MSILGPGPEFDLIRELVATGMTLPEGVLQGPGDDCALLEGGLVVSVDLSVEDVHFRREWIDLQDAGYRAASGALSDLAAMAAEPIGVFLSLALPPETAGRDAPALQKGAREACSREGTAILGGDLSASPGPVALDVVVLGRTDTPLLRSGGSAGEELWVTGWLGGSSAAVHLWEEGKEPDQALREAYARPRPRIRELRWLARRVELGAGIDISDGLAGDAGHLAAASGLEVSLEVDAIPVHPSVVEEVPDPALRLHFALRGGEDYEVVFSAPEGTVERHVLSFRERFGIPLTRVGRMGEGRGVMILDSHGTPIPPGGGFSHFQEGVSE